MGFDWESILDTSGTGVAEAYDRAVYEAIGSPVSSYGRGSEDDRTAPLFDES